MSVSGRDFNRKSSRCCRRATTFFANGIENVTLRLTNSPEGFSDARLGNQYEVDGHNYYRLLVCRKCGQPFGEGFQDADVLRPLKLRGQNTTRQVFWLGEPPERFDDEGDDSGGEPESPGDEWMISPQTGQLNSSVGRAGEVTSGRAKKGR